MENTAPQGLVPPFSEHLRTVPKRAVILNKYGRSAHEMHIKEMLGLPRKLPEHAVPAQVIQGVKVWVNPPLSPEYRTRYDGKVVKVHRAMHRVMCECPKCGADMSVGRLAQHKCKE